MKISTRVHPPVTETSLLNYLSNRFTYRPRAAWQALIEEGFVEHNGRVATLETTVKQGDRLTTEFPDPDPPDANYNYTIVYEDEWLLGINKPTNLRVHGRGRYINANLIYHVRQVREPAYPTAELANRLDANTTGVVLLTKDKETVRRMNKLFEARTVQKSYIALVHGRFAETEGVIDRPIGKLPSSDRVYRYGCGEGAEKLKEAQTEFCVVQEVGEDLSLVALKPLTGRTHQLRVHMAELGHPLVGDMLYQMDDERFLRYCDEPEAFERPLLGRHALHCIGNSFPHPWRDETCVVEAPLPEDMQLLISS